MIHVENAYRLNVIAPTTHNYIYTDAETTVRHDTVSPVTRTNPLRTELSSGFAACLYDEFADSATVHDYIEWEDTDGNTHTLAQRSMTEWNPAYYQIVYDGTPETFAYSFGKWDFCLRTDSITLTANGYVAGGRIFLRGYREGGGTMGDSWTLSNAKLSSLAWSQDEKIHTMTMSG